MRKAVQATLSSVEAYLCRSEAGEKEKESARQYGKGKAPVFYLFPSSPARLLFSHYCYFYWDTQREPLGRRERCGRKEINKYRISPSGRPLCGKRPTSLPFLA